MMFGFENIRGASSFLSFDAYVIALAPTLVLLVVLGFYLCWKRHFYSQIDE
jgi:hypothetical protein